jgi:hypothetical protein
MSLSLLALPLALALSAPPDSIARFELGWNGCGRQGAAATTVACSHADSVLRLVGSFQVPDTISGVVAMEVTLDFRFEKEIPPFWRLDADGCNRRGLVVNHVLPDAGCQGVDTPWGARGGGATAFAIAYLLGESGKAQQLLAMNRNSDDPVTLVPGRSYFAFELVFFNDASQEAGGACAGCATPFDISWSSARLGIPGQPHRTLRAAEAPCVGVNGAAPGCGRAEPKKPARAAKRVKK